MMCVQMRIVANDEGGGGEGGGDLQDYVLVLNLYQSWFECRCV